MWKARALFLALAAIASTASADVTLTAADFVSAAKVSVCAELGILDGGPLSQALSQAAAKGVHLRLLLDPADLGTRQEGRALQRAFQSLSPAAGARVELRWRREAGSPQRRLLSDAARLLRWLPGESVQRDDSRAADFARRFEEHWSAAAPALPEALALEDDLKALPDPRDNDPRITRRREAAGE